MGSGRLPAVHALLRGHIRRPGGYLGLVGGRARELLGLGRVLVLRPACEPPGGGGPRASTPLLCGRAGGHARARPLLHRDGPGRPGLTGHGGRQPGQRGSGLRAGRGLVRAWLPGRAWPSARPGHGFRAGTLVPGWCRVDGLLRLHARGGLGDLGDLSARGPTLVRRHGRMTLLDRGCLHPGLPGLSGHCLLPGHHRLSRHCLLPGYCLLAWHDLLARCDLLARHDLLAGPHLLARPYLLAGPTCWPGPACWPGPICWPGITC